jgi:hypothetical protein
MNPVPGLVPGIHVFLGRSCGIEDVGGRDKPGHGAFTGIVIFVFFVPSW